MAEYNDTNDHTVIVDPVRRHHWIYDGDTKHAQSADRRNAFEVIALQRSLGWERSHQDPPTKYMPSTSQLDTLPKFQSCLEASQKCGADVAHDGQLPSISQMLYDNTLLNKSIGQIEHETREVSRRVGGRLFDRTGYGG